MENNLFLHPFLQAFIAPILLESIGSLAIGAWLHVDKSREAPDAILPEEVREFILVSL